MHETMDTYSSTLHKSVIVTIISLCISQKTMTLKFVLLAIVISLYSTEAVTLDEDHIDKSLGGDDYLPCEYCHIPKENYPEEG